MKQVIGRFKFTLLKAVTLAASAGLLSLGFVSSASAYIISATGQSISMDLTVKAGLGPVIPFVLGQVPGNTSTSGGSLSGPLMRSNSNSLASFNIGNGFTTDKLNASSATNVPVVGGPGSATASASIANLKVLLDALGTSVKVNSIGSSIMVSRNAANVVSATATTTIIGASLAGAAGVTTPLSMAVNPAPNTVVFNAGGIMVMLNEQLFNGSTKGTFCTPVPTCTNSLTVNAVHASFKNALFGNYIVNGSIVLASSLLTLKRPLIDPFLMTEPATFLLFGMGLVGVFFIGKRRMFG